MISEAESFIPQKTPLKQAKCKVLIVEDNELNSKLFRDLLEADGYTTLQAKNGHEALHIVRQHRPDLILMDIGLPDISGLEVTELLKADMEFCNIPVIAVSAYAMRGDEEKARLSGCDEYMTKPIAITKFRQVVDRYSK